MEQGLPKFDASQFASSDLPECDLIMKGGITSGIVYPYAVLELATKYKFRSVGGTSAGAIAAAFAAAAEYSRSERGDPGGFVRLQSWCDQLPDQLLSLFQPDPSLAEVTDLGLRALKAKSWKPLLKRILLRACLEGVVVGVSCSAATWWLSRNLLAAILAAPLGFLFCVLASTFFHGNQTLVRPVLHALHNLPLKMFGFCSGLTMPGSSSMALTDWLHAALQDIAFGENPTKEVLTFGHLENATRGREPINLRMVTTNLSMMRPHTLPDFGMQAGYDPDEWRELFPGDVLDHLLSRGVEWKGLRSLPSPGDLPVIVATRMSLSFPFLFKAIPVHAEDYETFRITRALGGHPQRTVKRMWLSDGGISSNFPIHLFDAPLPQRPTFAFSLDELKSPPAEIERRVLLPADATIGLGLPITDVPSISKFAAQVVWSAKDWQDQLLAGITGQRERIAHVYLEPGEGGLNLGMSADSSRKLMAYGREAGKLFATEFNFDEHRWRRLLSFYKNSTRYIDSAGLAWNSGYHAWYKAYHPSVKSYKMSGRSMNRVRIAIDVMLVPPPLEQRLSPSIATRKLPRRTGSLRNSPEY